MTDARDSVTAQPLYFSLSLGTLAGAALIATVSVTSWGQAIFIPYALLIGITWLFLRQGRVPAFRRRFNMSLGAFTIASLLVYGFIATVPTDAWRVIPLVGHAWRLAVILGIGVPLSAAVAQVSAPRP